MGQPSHVAQAKDWHEECMMVTLPGSDMVTLK